MPAVVQTGLVHQRSCPCHRIAPAGNLSFNSSDALLRSAARGAGFVYVLDMLAQGIGLTGKVGYHAAAVLRHHRASAPGDLEHVHHCADECRQRRDPA